MLKENRRKEILKQIKLNGSVRTAELSEIYSTSRQTIHKDIDYLSKNENVKKVYGGAVLKSKTQEPSIKIRRVEHAKEKDQIGKVVAQFIHENDTLYLDVSTTVAKMIPYLKSFNQLTILTNSIENAYLLSEYDHLDIIMIGGKVRSKDLACSSPSAVQILKNYFVDKAFFGTGGISAEVGYTDFHLDDSEIRKVMIQNATQTFVLADASKVGVVTISKFADLDEIDTFVSYGIQDQTILDALEKENVQYIDAKIY